MPTDNRPSPPQEIEGEALLEWGRVCDELESAGRLDKADRAILVLYCETWDVYVQSMRHVRRFGAVVKHTNGTAGASPLYKVSRETSNQLHKLLADSGLTPAARHRMKSAVAEVPAEMEF